MSLIKELQQFVQIDGEVSGRVISVSGTSVVVATDAGQVEVSSSSNLYVGDMVTVEAGRATKKQRGGDVSVYFV